MRTKTSLLIALTLAAAAAATPALAIECTSGADKVTAITENASFPITTRFQFDTPSMQTLLTTTINKGGRGCVVAHLSGLGRITDNYIVLQVTIDGVPMHGGMLTGLATPDTPVASITISEYFPISNDEQLADPTKVASFNFFDGIGPGTHRVEVRAAAGSGIDPMNPPSLSHLVLTLEYR